MNSKEYITTQVQAKYGDDINSFGGQRDGYTAGAEMMLEHMGKFIEWWHRDYRYYPSEGFMHKSDGRKPFIEVEYLTTGELISEYFKTLTR